MQSLKEQKTINIVPFYKSIIITIFLVFNIFSTTTAQNIESIGKEKPILITGSLSATGIGYRAFGISSRRDPFTYFLNGNINVSIYGWSIPFSLNYSNQNTVFQQPFNQYGLSPTYKWLTLHLGYRSMNFSSYSLSGYTFYGVGIEATPSIFRVSAMYGRLNKAVPYDSLNAQPTYERIGYGFKIGVGKESNFIDFIVFKAYDKKNSLPFDTISEVYPAENLVLGINGSKQVTKNISVGAEYASSAYTRDLRGENINLGKQNVYSYTGNLFSTKSSSSYYNAFKTNVSYAGARFGVQLGYERIDPEYITMGAYFFNNDIENITVNTNTNLFKNKFALNFNIGSQRNNLNDQKTATQRRLIASLSCNYSPTANINFAGTYSNFNSNSRRAARFNEIAQASDTLLLNFVQVSQNANFSGSYSGGKINKYSFGLNLSYQVANERQGTVVTDNKSDIYNANLSLNYKLKDRGPSLTASFNTNRSIYEGQNSLTYGPSLSASKNFAEKVKTTLGCSYNEVVNNSEKIGSTVNARINTGYTWMKKHNFNLSVVMMNKLSSSQSNKSFSEYTGTVSYGFSF